MMATTNDFAVMAAKLLDSQTVAKMEVCYISNMQDLNLISRLIHLDFFTMSRLNPLNLILHQTTRCSISMSNTCSEYWDAIHLVSNKKESGV